MTTEHDPRRAPGHRERATESRTMMAIGASASASLSIVDIPAIVRRRARHSPHDAASSGLVDVAELCFGAGLSGGTATTQLVPMPADPTPARQIDHERGLLWTMTAAAAIAVVAMFAVAIGHRPAPVVIRAQAEPAPVMAASTETPDDEGEEARAVLDGGIALAPSDDDATPEAGAPAPSDASDDAPAPAPQSKPAAPTKATAPRTTAPRTSKPAASVPAARPESAANAKPSEVSVECVLDPASCGLGGTATKPAAPAVASPAKTLPDKLGTTALRAVLEPVKRAAQACGPRHGAASGTQVQVKLSITGATGRVQSATAMGDHAGTALGKCVADALATPVFPRFAAVQQGVVWPIRL